MSETSSKQRKRDRDKRLLSEVTCFVYTQPRAVTTQAIQTTRAKSAPPSRSLNAVLKEETPPDICWQVNNIIDKPFRLESKELLPAQQHESKKTRLMFKLTSASRFIDGSELTQFWTNEGCPGQSPIVMSCLTPVTWGCTLEVVHGNQFVQVVPELTPHTDFFIVDLQLELEVFWS